VAVKRGLFKTKAKAEKEDSALDKFLTELLQNIKKNL